MSGDWADERAREYNVKWWKNDWEKPNAALAALLREVREAQFSDRCVYPHWCQDEHEPLGFRGDGERCPACKLRDDLLAEVRRVVEEYASELLDLALGFASDAPGDPRSYYQREAAGARGVLARLEAL